MQCVDAVASGLISTTTIALCRTYLAAKRKHRTYTVWDVGLGWDLGLGKEGGTMMKKKIPFFRWFRRNIA